MGCGTGARGDVTAGRFAVSWGHAFMLGLYCPCPYPYRAMGQDRRVRLGDAHCHAPLGP